MARFSELHRGVVATLLECIAEALLGSAAEGNFLIGLVKDEGGFVAGLAAEVERGLEVKDEGAVESGEGWRGEEFFVLPEWHADHDRRGVFQVNAREVALRLQNEEVTHGDCDGSLGCAKADVIFGSEGGLWIRGQRGSAGGL
jgi:hypothetical protein